MNTVLVPSFGYRDFSSFVENVKQSASRFAGTIFERSPSEALSTRFPSINSVGIADTVKELAIGSSVSLSPQLHLRIKELSELNANWDGEGAKTVKPHVLADVVETLKRLVQRTNNFRDPFLAPSFDGFVQIEWHDKKRSLEIEAVNQGWSVAGTMIGADGKRLYFTASCERSDFGQLQKFYEWFLGNEFIWPSP